MCRNITTLPGLEPAATPGSLFYAVTRHVEDRATERIHPVFLLDEAHLLHQDTLDHLHILLNYGWDSRALLSLILVGLPELRERLALRRNRSLFSRIHHRLEIPAEFTRWRSPKPVHRDHRKRSMAITETGSSRSVVRPIWP